MIENNFNIENFLDLEGYEQSRLDRRKNNKEGKSTQEFFTPYSIVKKMCDKISEEDRSNPNKTFSWFAHLKFYIKYERYQ